MSEQETISPAWKNAESEEATCSTLHPVLESHSGSPLYIAVLLLSVIWFVAEVAVPFAERWISMSSASLWQSFQLMF